MTGWTPSEDWQDTQQESVYIEGEHLRVYNFVTKREKPFITPREFQILKNLSAQLTPKQIAKKLKITTATVYCHIHNLRHKVFRLKA